MKPLIKIGIGNPEDTANDFIDVWKRAESGEKIEAEHRLYFENLETLLKMLTPPRWVLLKTLRINGPMSVDSLADTLGRDYNNIHSETKELEMVGIISRTAKDLIEVPWDIIEAQLKLAA